MGKVRFVPVYPHLQWTGEKSRGNPLGGIVSVEIFVSFDLGQASYTSSEGSLVLLLLPRVASKVCFLDNGTRMSSSLLSVDDLGGRGDS